MSEAGMRVDSSAMAPTPRTGRGITAHDEKVDA